MERYHKSLYYPKFDGLNILVNELNQDKCKITSHSLERIKEREDVETIGNFLKGLTLKENDIFEYYKEGANIEKLCFRIAFNSQKDLILVLSQNKRIITVFFNSKEDNHITLNKENYSLK